MSDTKRKVFHTISGVLVVISLILVVLSVCTFISGRDDTPESQACETIGYAIVNGKRYDITCYATNNGHPYVKTVDGMKICGAGITVFIPED